jgi:hypothetical protein
MSSIQKVLAVLFFSLLFAMPAHARKGFALFNTGDELFAVADFPAEFVAENPKIKDFKVGYKCSHFGLFYADVWTWDCKMVSVKGEDTYSSLPDEVATKLSADPKYAFGNAQRGFWNHYAFWAALGALALLIVIGSRLPDADKTKEASA